MTPQKEIVHTKKMGQLCYDEESIHEISKPELNYF